MSFDEIVLAASFELYRAASFHISINIALNMHEFLEPLGIFPIEAAQFAAEFDEKHGCREI